MLLDYRKDIDGLRALAVLLVVFFHAGFTVSGGFVGVDIFFVISGFLIASLIQKQILRGKFTFKGFYLHRMRRILPALLLVITTVFIFNFLVLLPDDLLFFSKSSIFSLLSVSNIFFWLQGNSYFSKGVEEIQLLHTWSLSIEEQFYIGVPIFLIILFKYFYQTKWFNYILGFVLITSLAISQYSALKYPAFAYYNLPARFFELFIGVWLALNYSKLPISNNKVVNNLLSTLGLSLILIPAFFITKESLFPGYNALFVCLGSAILIYIGKAKEKTIITKFLSLKPVVFIGLISYSLYLWHWPVFSTIDILNIPTSNSVMLLIITIVIFISYVSWKFVEQPFRYKFKWSFIKTFIILFLIPVLTLLLIYISKPIIFNYLKQDNLVKTAVSYSHEKPELCYSYAYKDKKYDNSCTLGANKKKNYDMLVYGDSHANAISGFLEPMLKSASIKALPITAGGTVYFKDVDYIKFGRKGNDLEDIKYYFNTVENEIKTGNYKYVVFSSYYNYHVSKNGENEILQAFYRTIDFIEKHNKKLIIIKDIPTTTNLKARCKVYSRVFDYDINCNIDKAEVDKKHKAIERIFNNIKNKYPNVLFIDPKDVSCDDSICYTYFDETSLYKDSSHLTYLGAKYLGQKYLEKYGNPFAKLLEKH